MANIIIPARDRLQWHSQMLWDLRLSHTDFRVGVCIGTYFNNKTGKTFVGLDRIAEDLGIDRASVARSVASLKQHEHLHVDSGGGRCVANEYRMRLKTIAPVPLLSEETVARVRPFEDETVANASRNRRTGATTTLTFPSGKNSTPSRGPVFVLADSEDAEAWKAHARSRGQISPTFIDVHNGKRGRWMPIARPAQVDDVEAKQPTDEEKARRSGR